MRISDWSADVCSSDLLSRPTNSGTIMCGKTTMSRSGRTGKRLPRASSNIIPRLNGGGVQLWAGKERRTPQCGTSQATKVRFKNRSEEHTSELQSLMRISYAVFCLKKKKNTT